MPKKPQQQQHRVRAWFAEYARWGEARRLLFDPKRTGFAVALALILEAAVNVFVINYVPYTEIDWRAYMQECEGFLNGTRDYALLRGDTGPLVYPAGFVYVYSALYYLTDRGRDVRTAQYVFAAIYLAQLHFAFKLYRRTLKVPPYALLVAAFTSYRIHSIYVLRLFNDPVTMLPLFVALNLFLDSRWTLGSAFFSVAVSIKMNVLLFAPALLLFYLHNLTIAKTLQQLIICGAIQLFLGAPFLLDSPVAYLRNSFDIGRVFEHKWTVNYRFLDESIFVSKPFHLTLLCLHLCLLGLFYPLARDHFRAYRKLKHVQSQIEPEIAQKKRELELSESAKSAKNGKARRRRNRNEAPLDSDERNFISSYEKSLKTAAAAEKSEISSACDVNFGAIDRLFVLPMFLCNLIGVACARSLHYQFYSWYFHTLPYLMWCTPYSDGVRLLILALVELCWNVYPSTAFSSLLLHACHATILVGIYRATRGSGGNKS